MGFRYRSTIRILPGLRVNLSKSGASLSVGRRGATVNLGKRGVKTTVGLPGSGLSYSETKPWHRRIDHQGQPPARSGFNPLVTILALVAIGAVLLIFGRRSDFDLDQDRGGKGSPYAEQPRNGV